MRLVTRCACNRGVRATVQGANEGIEGVQLGDRSIGDKSAGGERSCRPALFATRGPCLTRARRAGRRGGPWHIPRSQSCSRARIHRNELGQSHDAGEGRVHRGAGDAAQREGPDAVAICAGLDELDVSRWQDLAEKSCHGRDSLHGTEAAEQGAEADAKNWLACKQQSNLHYKYSLAWHARQQPAPSLRAVPSRATRVPGCSA